MARKRQQFHSKADVRKWLADRLKLPAVADDLWAHDEVQENVEKHLAENEPLALIESVARRLIRDSRRITRAHEAIRAGLPSVQRGAPERLPLAVLTPTEQAKADALALLLARSVAQGDKDGADDVPRFRREVLADSYPLSQDEASAFITSAPAPTMGPSRRFYYEKKHYRTARGGPVDRLWTLALALAERHGWDTTATMRFILAGEIPPLHPITMTVDHRPFTIPPSGEITLRIAPWVGENTVRLAYQQAKKHLARGIARGNGERIAPSYGDVNGRNLRIFRFVQERTDVEGRRGTWKALLQAWNAECDPNERGNSYRNFQRDYKAAERSLMALLTV